MTDWEKYPHEAMQAGSRMNAFRETLTPEQRKEYAETTRILRAIPLGVLLGQPDPTLDLIQARTVVTARKVEQDAELTMRRKWAALIHEEFGKYHEHEGGGPCGACGAIQAANWMDPNYIGDGPKAEGL